MTPTSAARKLIRMADELRRHPLELPYAWRWLRSMLPGHSPLGDEIPWITFRAMDWLDSYLQPQMKVFEYGAGGSTIYLAKRIQDLVSVEHDAEFFKIVKSRLRELALDHCDLELHLPEPCDESSSPFPSFQPKYRGMCFSSYVKAIDRYPDKYFDLVLVDGRARIACVARAAHKVKAGGALLLDNSDRLAYVKAYEFMGKNTCRDFAGLTPWNMEVSQTTIWTIQS